MISRSDPTIPGLLSDALSQLAKLIGNEFDLVKAELSEKIGQTGRGVAMIGAGAVIMIPSLVVLLFAAAAALMHAGFSAPIAYLITGGAPAIFAAVLVGMGISRMSGGALKPSMTIEQIQKDQAVAKEVVR
jgi:hypothetical protein